MNPLLKWAGGKRKLLPLIFEYINKDELAKTGNKLYEPFVGGGSLFLNLELSRCSINDYNPELINTYIQIRDNPLKLINLLEEHKKNHSLEYYTSIRALDRRVDYSNYDDIKKAARFIYLNKTCYNGLYRVNSKGFFNVPMGKYENPDIVAQDRILRISEYLNSNEIEITLGDFESAVLTAETGDVIYFDPPYDYEKEGFTSYVSNGFTRDDLKRLRKCCDSLVDIGCKVIISNNDTEFVNTLFNDQRYTIKKIEVQRLIGSSNKSRRKEKEVIIYGKDYRRY
ncbi:MAG: Dam family site-specific DNA-(adenine-N6)-methyltransferase [Erysipelothrix sp.]|jgi:DNA adenine methylase|nr:Dam family site-specific DNA-(adenine-N6)-methyltransferase [Erysipelothrix sp.]